MHIVESCSLASSEVLVFSRFNFCFGFYALVWFGRCTWPLGFLTVLQAFYGNTGRPLWGRLLIGPLARRHGLAAEGSSWYIITDYITLYCIVLYCSNYRKSSDYLYCPFSQYDSYHFYCIQFLCTKLGKKKFWEGTWCSRQKAPSVKLSRATEPAKQESKERGFGIRTVAAVLSPNWEFLSRLVAEI